MAQMIGASDGRSGIRETKDAGGIRESPNLGSRCWVLSTLVMIDMTRNPFWDNIDCVRVCLQIILLVCLSHGEDDLEKGEDDVFRAESHLLQAP